MGWNRIGNLEHEVVVATPVLGITTVGLLASRPLAVVGVRRALGAVVLEAIRALGAVATEAGAALGANTHAVPNLDAVGDFAADTGRLANNFVPYHARVGGGTPAGGEGVDVGAADAAVGDLNVDVGLFELLGLVGLPGHVALGGVRGESHPSLESRLARHCV